MHEAAKDVSFAAVMFDCTFIREAIADLKLSGWAFCLQARRAAAHLNSLKFYICPHLDANAKCWIETASTA